MSRGFRGSSPLTLDAKGRMSVPAKFRERLREVSEGEIVITISRDPCLLIYPMPEWEKLEAEVEKLPGMDKRVANFKRRFFGRAEEFELDAQGRVLVPPRLREAIGLERAATLVGVVNKLELWPSDKWEALNEQSLDDELDDLDLPEALQSLPL